MKTRPSKEEYRQYIALTHRHKHVPLSKKHIVRVVTYQVCPKTLNFKQVMPEAGFEVYAQGTPFYTVANKP